MQRNPTLYLNRIGYNGPTRPDEAALSALHLAHLRAVPFENLDIHWQRPIHLEEGALYDKIVHQRRGGFCYELNGLFAWLLRNLGYSVTLLSARVFSGGQPGPEYDHLALLVHLGEPWLVDVGFGDSFLQPLRFRVGEEQAQANGRYRLAQTGEEITLYRQQDEAAWEAQYLFSPQSRQLSEFADMCHYHQTSPDSSFTRRRVCTLATADGRITLSDSRLIVTIQGARQETAVADESAFADLLWRHFAIAQAGAL